MKYGHKCLKVGKMSIACESTWDFWWNCKETKNSLKFPHFNVCLLLIFDIRGHAATGRILEGFGLDYVEDLCEVSFSEVCE